MFNNKSILITGASSGLGRELSIQLSKQDAQLILVARNKEQLEETYKLCLQANRNVIVLLVIADITQSEDCENAVLEALSYFGRIDYLILNAGISMWSKFEDIQDISIIHKLMETNYFGAVNCIFHALPHLVKSKGMIVAISSIQGKIAVPYHSGYSASKHALQSFLDTLRLELNDKVRILTVSPGWIKGTDLKKNAYQSTSQVEVKHHDEAISVEYCANQILKAMGRQQKELVLPFKYRILPWLKLLSPKLLDFLILRRL